MADRSLLESLDDRLAIVGTSGSGKTYAAKGLVEILVRLEHRVCVVDPLGVWWGLRTGTDGAAAGGLPVTILGGAHADVQITEAMGGAVGRLIGRSAAQCVLDLAELPSKAARQRFMRAFLGELYETNVDPLHLVLDEADMWAPQRPGPDEAMLQGLVSEIVRRGRVRGFVPWLITQRPAVLTKDALSQADTLVAFKLTSSQDRAAIGAWIEGQADRAVAKRVLAELPGLPRGEAYLWAPGRSLLQRTGFPALTTYDSSRTPGRGERHAGAALAPIDTAAIAAALQSASDGAETTKASSNAPPGASREQLAAAREEGRRVGRAEADAEIARLGAELANARARIDAALAKLLPSRSEPVRQPIPATPAAIEPRQRRPASAGLATPPTRPAEGAKLHPAARAVLAVLAAHAPARLTWRQVATLAGLAPSGGHWNAGRKQLRDTGLVEEGGNEVWATAAGVAAAGAVPPAPRDAGSVLELWCSKLPSPGPEMLRVLAAAETLTTRAQLAAILNKKPTGGHWNAGLKALRVNGLVEETSAGLQAVAELKTKPEVHGG